MIKFNKLPENLDLIGTIENVLKTEEFDLVILNTTPIRFVYNILKTERLKFCKDKNFLIDFTEKTNKFYLDFKYFREQFDKTFLKELGYEKREDLGVKTVWN